MASSASSALPEGWVTFEPSEERLRCANHAQDAWRIASEQGVVKIVQATRREPDRGPALPFELPKQGDMEGVRHVLALGGGFLVGVDAGAGSGALYWFAGDGRRQQKFAGEHVRGLVALDPRRR